MRIAVYSGTFDPIHTGHAVVANYIAQFTDCDEVWMIVSRLNPFKTDRLPNASDADRLAMAQIVAREIDRVEVSDIELGMDFPSYSHRTLTALKERYPQHEFRLVVGADNWHDFYKWRNAEAIIEEFGLLIYPRPGYDLSGVTFPPHVEYLADAPVMEISSTFIRKGIREGKNMRYFIPPSVDDYIKEHSLYK